MQNNALKFMPETLDRDGRVQGSGVRLIFTME
jgi:hypothetical protein